GIVAVPEKDLPVLLPHVEKYEPTGDGTSPLSNESDPAIAAWLNTTCPECGGKAKRETNTMPQWAGSCWYYIAYLMKQGNEYVWDRDKIDPWLPVNLYVGGAEHAVLHLLYSRFWHKVLYDEKLVGSIEPFQKLISVGTILGIDGVKMSKSRGNVIDPDPLIEKFGSDALKMYELYIGPFSQPAKWSQNGIVGMHRFLQKVEKISDTEISSSNDKNLVPINKAIKKVTADIESFSFNTAISTLIETFDLISTNGWNKPSAEIFLTLLSPFAPKMVEQVSQKLGIQISVWPEFDSKYIADDKVTIAIQINGKVRDQIEIAIDESEEKVKELVLEREKIKSWILEAKIKKFIYVPGKIISIVV
ncbi:MAG: class I tRNA ligase family protein, partial [Candidatus Berkelbacteria bacterium]